MPVRLASREQGTQLKYEVGRESIGHRLSQVLS